MLRRGISILLCLSIVNLWFFSCGRNDVVEPDSDNNVIGLFGGDDRLANVSLDNPGKLHNEIMVLMLERDFIGKARTVTGDEFIESLVECANTVYQCNDVHLEITKGDVIILLKHLEELYDKDVIDAFHPTKNGLQNVFYYMAEQDMISDKAADSYTKTLFEVERADNKMMEMSSVSDLIKRSVSTDDTELDAIYTDLLDNSYSFWTDIEKGETFVTVLGDTVHPDPDAEKEFWQKVTSYGTDVSLGITLAIIIVPASIPISIACIIASTLASLVPEQAWFWDSFWSTVNIP